MTTTRSSTSTSGAATTAALQHDYLSADEIASQSPAWWQNVLGVVGFEKLPAIEGSRVPLAASMTPALGANDAVCEVWRVAGSGVQLPNGVAQRGRVRYRCGRDFLFGSISIDERLLEPESAVPGDAGVAAGALLRATEIAYQEIFAVLRETAHPHLIRIWNYVPEINREAGGDERYRLFNSARQMAFRNSGQAMVGSVPAASALGSPAGSHSPSISWQLGVRRK